MHICNVTYEDFDGTTVTEKLHFNLSKRELIRMEAELPGGVGGLIKIMTEEKDKAKVFALFEDIVLRSFGLRPDATHFRKNTEIREEFESSLAYEKMFEKLSMEEGSEEFMAEFIKGVFPKDMTEAAQKAMEEAGGDIAKALETVQEVDTTSTTTTQQAITPTP